MNYKKYLINEEAYSEQLDDLRDTILKLQKRMKSKKLSPDEIKKLQRMKDMAMEMMR